MQLSRITWQVADTITGNASFKTIKHTSDKKFGPWIFVVRPSNSCCWCHCGTVNFKPWGTDIISSHVRAGFPCFLESRQDHSQHSVGLQLWTLLKVSLAPQVQVCPPCRALTIVCPLLCYSQLVKGVCFCQFLFFSAGLRPSLSMNAKYWIFCPTSSSHYMRHFHMLELNNIPALWGLQHMLQLSTSQDHSSCSYYTIIKPSITTNDDNADFC